MGRPIANRTRRAEQIAQSIILDRLMAKYQPLIRNEIRTAMKRYGNAYGNQDTLGVIGAEQGHIDRMTKLMNRLWTESGKLFSYRFLDFVKTGLVRKDYQVLNTETMDKIVSNWALAYGAQKITQITSTTIRDIKFIVSRGIQEGWTEKEVAAQISLLAPSKSDSRAQTIARTETHSASQAIQFEAAEILELDMVKVWTTAIDERTRTIADGAQFDHVAADGQRVGMNETFTIEGVNGNEDLLYPSDPAGSAGNVINCFDGDVPVSFNSLKKSIRSIYNGEIITIETSSGYKITATPNHPILTKSGFIRLDEVNHLTELACCPLNINFTNGLNVDNIPVTFKQTHDTLSVIGMIMRMGSVIVNLYSRIPDSNVNIVSPKSELRGASVSKFIKKVHKNHFKITDFRKTFFFANSLFNRIASMKLFRHVSHSVISFSNLFKSFIFCHLRPFQSFGFRLVSAFDIIVSKYSFDCIALDTMFNRNAIFANARNIIGNNIGTFRVVGNTPRNKSFSMLFNNLINKRLANVKLFSNFGNNITAFVHFDNIVKIDRKIVHNHSVYTIETDEGIYNAGGIIAQNCRCIVVYELA
jgi:hypothetical protein